MDEEKSFEIIMHEKRVEARERVRAFMKLRRKAALSATLFLVIMIICLSPLTTKLYDNEMLIALAGVIAAIATAFIFAYCLLGKFICGKNFIKNSRLVNKWRSASAEMDKMEEKSFERTAFEEDVTAAEEKICELSDLIIERINL